MIETAQMPRQAGLMQFFTAKWFAPVIGALARLRIADQVVEEAKSADELAAATGADPRSLYRLLRAAASVGVFQEDDQGRFGLTPLAEGLQSDVQGSLRAAAEMFGLEPFWAPYGRILHSVMTGEPAFDQIYGMSIYEYLEEHPQDAQIFGEAVGVFHAQSLGPIVAAHDLAPYGTIVDIGGGNGSLLAEVLHEHPAARGVLLEQASVLPAARTFLDGQGLAGRVELVAGDFFVSVPPGDAFLIKSCLHNFSDARTLEVLEVIRQAMPRGAPLLIAETMIPAGNEPHYSKFDDVEMLVIAGGADRTEQEWRNLVSSAGFRPGRLVPGGSRFSVLEAFAQ